VIYSFVKKTYCAQFEEQAIEYRILAYCVEEAIINSQLAFYAATGFMPSSPLTLIEVE